MVSDSRETSPIYHNHGIHPFLDVIKPYDVAVAVSRDWNVMALFEDQLNRQYQQQQSIHLSLGRILGKGAQSNVYLLKNRPLVVVKEYLFTVHKVSTRRQCLRDLAEMYNVSVKMLRRYNARKLRTWRKEHHGETFTYETPLGVNFHIAIPQGGRQMLSDWKARQRDDKIYRCTHAFLSEIIVASLLSQVTCPHFVKYYGFVYREDAAFITMERLTDNMESALRQYPNRLGYVSIVRSLLWQAAVAILAMQTSYRIVHYDLNAFNIFLKYHKPKDDPTQYHLYKIRNTTTTHRSYWMPNLHIQLKVGDFGFAGAFGRQGPYVVREEVYDNKFEDKGWNIANGFQKGYDMLFFINCLVNALRNHVYANKCGEAAKIKTMLDVLAVDLHKRFQVEKAKMKISPSPTPPLPSPPVVPFNNTMKSFIQHTAALKHLRPRRTASLLLSPRDVLNSSIFNSYKTHPQQPSTIIKHVYSES